jgi:hypothetical protein
MDLFTKAKKYNDLQESTIKFLKNEIDMTNYHCGPPDEETDMIKDYLVLMNRYGCVTTGSQPGMSDHSENYYQRAFVTMLIKKDDYDDFKHKMEALMGSYVYIHNTTEDDHSEYETTLSTSASDYMLKSKFWVSAKFNAYDPTFKYEGYTHVSKAEYECESFMDLKIHKKLCKEYMEIELVDLVWGRVDDLFKNILSVLE